MKNLKLFLTLLMLMCIGVTQMWGADPAATATATSGKSYVIAYWNGSKYIALDPAIVSTSASTFAGTDVTVNSSGKVTTANPPLWTLTVNPSNSNQFYISCEISSTTYYLYKNGTSSSSNYNIKRVASGQHYWTFSKSSNKYSIKSERGSAAQYLNYYTSGSVWEVNGTTTANLILLEPAAAGPSITPSVSELDWGTVAKGAVLTTKTFTITGTNLTSADLVYSASGGYSVSPSGKAGAAGTLSSQTLTVTPPSTATPGTYNSTVSITGGGLASAVTVNVKLKVENTDTFIDEVQNTSGYTSASPHIEQGSYGTTPTIADKSVATSGTCEQLHYHFVGWITAAKYEAGTSIAIGDLQTPTTATGTTYYAVWAKQGASTKTPTTINYEYSSSYSYVTRSGVSNYTTQGDYEFKFDNTGDYIQFNLDYPPTSLSFGYKMVGGASTSTMIIQECSTANGSYSKVEDLSISGAQNSTGTLTTSNSFSEKYVRMYFDKGSNVGVSTITIEGFTGGVSYSDYIAKCCTPLASINGSFFRYHFLGSFGDILDQPNSLTENR